MKILSISKDGGPQSNVTGFWLIEVKNLFSIVFLRFGKGSREVFHSHAFNALTWFIKGKAIEYHVDGRVLHWRASFKPKYTPRSCFHKVYAPENAYAFSIRGPWARTWREYLPNSRKFITLTHGRKQVLA
jgi:hypothetical protein